MTSQRSQWSASKVNPSKAKLQEVLLVRHDGPLLRVNFHPELTSLLREVRYMQLQGRSVPPDAKKVFERVEVYRKQVNSLDVICDQYNQVLLTSVRIAGLPTLRSGKIRSSLYPTTRHKTIVCGLPRWFSFVHFAFRARF